MAVSRQVRVRRIVRHALDVGLRARSLREGPSTPPSRSIRLASPGQIAVIYRWCTWVLAVGLIVTGASMTYGPQWHLRADVFVLLGLTFAVNVLLTAALRPYMRLMRRYPPIMLLDVLFCLGVYAQSNIWTSPFQFYSYSALMLPVAIFFFTGALAGSGVFLALNVALLSTAGYSFAWARANGVADTYLMQLAIVPLLAFVFAYPNRLYSQLRRAQLRLAVVEREQILLAERTRIAGSLHDSVAQILFGIGMLAESAQARLGLTGRDTAPSDSKDGAVDPSNLAAETLRQVHDLAARGNREMRRAIYSLREPGPARDELPASLSVLLLELAARTGVETHLSIGGIEQEAPDHASRTSVAVAQSRESGSSEPELETEPAAASVVILPEPVALALYQVAREALTNIEKHAGAFNVWADLRIEGVPGFAARGATQVMLSVRDDGNGFRRPAVAPLGRAEEDEVGIPHFGMSNMRSATESVGGRLEVVTRAGHGTTVTATVPLA